MLLFEDFISRVQHRIIHEKLPGVDAQFEMAHVNRERVGYDQIDVSKYRSSAVLLLLFPDLNNEPNILLIERMQYNGHHSGQIALPGGKTEYGETLEQTALREFYEETGCQLNPNIIGQLSPVYIPVSSFVVYPFIGYLKEEAQFKINPSEVQQLIYFPVKHLINPEFVKETIIEPKPHYKIKTPYFDVQGKILWGATAMMLNEFKHLAR